MRMLGRFGVMAVALAALATGGTAKASLIYGIGNNGKIVRVDLTNLTESTYAATPTGSNGNSVAVDSAGKNVYYRLSSSGPLYRLDTTNPSSGSTVLSLPSAIGTSSNASWYDGSYWTIRDGSNDLYRVNFDGLGNVSSFSTLADFNAPSTRGFLFGDIAISSDGRLYGTTSDNRFFRFDITGNTTSNFYLKPGTLSDTFQISLDPTETFLYVHSNNSGKWWTMNLDGDALTPIMKGGTQFTTTKLRDIAGAVAAVPEPASIATAGLGCLFGLGLMARRRFAGIRA